ncbi:hypothetical protein [Pedobacter suwonensis]|uniref:hypothetical protein n=1 Tax=Pedobacter suwonensis TaxID=332999 RepID=UPI00119F1BDA|nr:hypothetical protein [Pedobacter suwonensis]
MQNISVLIMTIDPNLVGDKFLFQSFSKSVLYKVSEKTGLDPILVIFEEFACRIAEWFKNISGCYLNGV